MARTVAEAFTQFKMKLLLTSAQKKLVKDRRSTTASHLFASFPSSSDLPLRTTKLIGSAGRNTIIRPLDDIDVLAVFTNRDGVFDRYRYDSQKFLYRVRDALNSYQVEVVGARGQAVRLFYKGSPHVDIAPVFQWSDGGYALPDGTGGWLTTDPDIHDRWITQREAELGANFKPMIRMIKRWNNVHSKYLKGFHIEVMLGATFTTIDCNSRRACQAFFSVAQRALTVPDPAGYGGNLSSYLSQSARAAVLSNLESAHDRSVKARAAASEGDHQEAIRLWRFVFGDEFPAYD